MLNVNLTKEQLKTIYPDVQFGEKVYISPENVKIGFKSVIEDGVLIGPNSTIHPAVRIGEHAKIGNDVTIEPGVIIGKYSMIASFVKIGNDAKIGDYVWLGQNVNIDSHTQIDSETDIRFGYEGITIQYPDLKNMDPGNCYFDHNRQQVIICILDEFKTIEGWEQELEKDKDLRHGKVSPDVVDYRRKLNTFNFLRDWAFENYFKIKRVEIKNKKNLVE